MDIVGKTTSLQLIIKYDWWQLLISQQQEVEWNNERKTQLSLHNQLYSEQFLNVIGWNKWSVWIQMCNFVLRLD